MVLVTMRVVIDKWEDFDQANREFMPKAKELGCHAHQVYRAEGVPDLVLVLQEWTSHEAMHQFAHQYSDAFDQRAKIQGEWEIWVWNKGDTLSF